MNLCISVWSKRGGTLLFLFAHTEVCLDRSFTVLLAFNDIQLLPMGNEKVMCSPVMIFLSTSNNLGVKKLATLAKEPDIVQGRGTVSGCSATYNLLLQLSFSLNV